MEYRRPLRILDGNGHPLAAHIERVLVHLRPRLQRQFPALRDEVLLADVMEEAGRRMALHEERSGPIEKLNGYAWVTLRSVATSQMRRGAMQLIQRSLGSHASEEELEVIPAETGTPEQIERDILLREALDTLPPDERVICIWKIAGFSSREIAKHQRLSIGAVDLLFWRAKHKIRKALGLREPNDNRRSAAREPSDAVAHERPTTHGRTESDNEDPRSGT